MDATLNFRLPRSALVTAALLACAVCSVVADASAPATTEHRELYRTALSDLRAGRLTSFQQARHELRDYALYPYLEFESLRRRMARLTGAEVESFMARWDDTPLARRLHLLWLDELVRRGDWQAYRQHYRPDTGTERHCHFLRALYRTGEQARALDGVPELWVVGRSQPKACDPIFAAWIQADGMTQAVAWERMMLALDARNPNLARYVRGFIRGELESYAERALALYRRPDLITQTADFDDDAEPTRDLVLRGVRWHARADAMQAAALWRHYRETLGFEPEVARRLEHDLWIQLARAGVISPDVDLRATPDRRHEQVAEALLMTSVRQAQWDKAVHWLYGLDEADRRQPKWQYWLARAALEDANDDAVAHEEYQAKLRELAQVRHYYGFLAAHQLGTAPNLNQRPSRAHPMVVAQVAQRSAMQRIAELHGIGDLVNARREWQFLMPRLSEAEQVAAVHLVAQIGWIDQAIHGANATELLDDLDLRFPTPFQPLFEQESERFAIPAALLFGIARQESAFATTARSPAGAVGLMQLMPATAGEVASRLGVRKPSANTLFEPELNVRLGSAYMAYLLERYDGHRVQAAAAYNAGPSRVDRWRRELHGLPTDAWIEAIPFSETRNYVKNVLAFSYIYGQRLGEGVPFLDQD